MIKLVEQFGTKTKYCGTTKLLREHISFGEVVSESSIAIHLSTGTVVISVSSEGKSSSDFVFTRDDKGALQNFINNLTVAMKQL